MKKWIFVFIVILISPHLWAGGPFQVTGNGDPYSWDSPISLHPETGTCATYSNAQMRARLNTNVSYWSNISNINLDFNIVTGTINADVTNTNFNDYFVDSTNDPGFTDDVNPVIFDDTGDIVDSIFGNNSHFSVLGFAGPDAFNEGTARIVDGQAVFNCSCLPGNPNGACTIRQQTVEFTESDLDFTMTHEIGHMIGLDHTQVNEALASGCNTSNAGDCTDLPAMYPQSVDAADQISPVRDDEVALQTLYGLTNLQNNGCTVTGALLDSSGNPLRCADVQATTNNTTDTIAVVSGMFAPNQDLNGDNYTDGTGECLSNCGDFVLRGLDPAKSYTITVMPISSGWTGGSGINPCVNGQNSGIQEEVIATISNCAAGGTQALGNVSTLSTGSSSSSSGGSSSGGSSGSSSSSTTLACGLTQGVSAGTSILLSFITMGIFLTLLFLSKYYIRFVQGITIK